MAKATKKPKPKSRAKPEAKERIKATFEESDAQEIAGLTLILSEPSPGKSRLRVFAFGGGRLQPLVEAVATEFRKRLQDDGQFDFSP